MPKPFDLRIYFNTNGVVKYYPVDSLEEANYLTDKLAEGDLAAGDAVDYNIIDLEIYDGETMDWETYYDREGLSFSEVQEEDFDGKRLILDIRYV